MKKLIIIFSMFISFIACEQEKEEVKRIQWTSSSSEAISLFNEFIMNIEHRRWNPEKQEALMDSILKIDPEFHVAKTYDNFGTREERQTSFLSAYENRDQLSEIEKRMIEAEYEIRVNGNRNKQDQLMDELIIDFPEYYQLRIWSGDIKNQLDVKSSKIRWEEALNINPKAFEAIANLAFLHFPTGNDFNMLAEDERDLNEAEAMLKKGEQLYPNSSRWPRFLGNVYRAQSDFDKALTSYKKSLELIEKYEAGKESNPYANSLLMVGHVNTFQGNYDEARKYYDQAIEISNSWWKVAISELKAHTYIYQKDFSKAIFLLSDVQEKIKEFDEEEIFKINTTSFLERTKFLAFGHSQKEEETLLSMEKNRKLGEQRLSIQLANAVDENQKSRFILDNKTGNLAQQIWFNILFGNYEKSNELMGEFKSLVEQQSAYNSNAYDEYHKFDGYLKLMEGNPEESIVAYSNLSKEVLGNDGYHAYFLALAKKATGQNEESKEMFVRLANDNFATWQNAIVKNLAKAQIKTNI